ncbi:MAG: hypothetical protein HY787_24075 [Deltaproteobacteria bacterium]|nr:hypothetical protein [Deltaproteobacteria bacterium]
MSKTSKPPRPERGPSPVSLQLLEITETYLQRLLKVKETDGEVIEIINNLARELDENQAMAEIFLNKVTAAQESFFPWFLPDLNRRVQSKTVKKGIKRALYLLKQKGIEPPSSTDQPKQGRGILKNIEPFQAEGYLSEFDGLKNQMVGLLIPKPARGRLFIFALIGSPGLESFQAVEVSKREVKDILADLEKQAGHAFFQADFSHAAYLLQEAHDRHSKLSTKEEGVYAGILSFLVGKKMIGQSPIIRSLLDQRKPLPSSDIQRLRQIPEIFYLLPEPGVMESHLRAIQEVRTGILILNEIQRRERIRTIVDKAVRESFPPETRPGLIRYLEEVAYLYVLRKRPEEAETIMHWVKTLEEEKALRLGQESPLLFWLMETALLAEVPGKTSIEEPKEQTTPGGIILPSWVRTEEGRR